MLSLKNPSLFRTSCYINGKWISAESKETISVDNPSTGAIIGFVPNCKGKETEYAINAMWDSWSAWKNLTPLERGKYLHNWYALIEENKEDLAKILTYEQGKPLEESIGEINLGASYLPWYAEEARRTYGDVIPTPRKSVRPFTFKKPLGPVVAVTPWNFPFSMITRKAAPALAAGCPILIKPASATPYSALALAALAHEAGFPAGIVNVITGSAKDIMHCVTNNSKVKKVSFTGSTPIGKSLMAQSAVTLKHLALELGGNAPFIVFEDADLELASKFFIAVKFRNAGQACIAANRILVHKNIYPQFLEKIITLTKNLKIADGFTPNVQIGPLINSNAISNIQSLIADALEKNAHLECGGEIYELGNNFFQPTILSGITPDMRIFKEEVFGPVAPIITFETNEEAISLANDTHYGLASYIFTKDLKKAITIPEKLEFGLCGINEGALTMAEAPFGGVKESGFGREGGHEGIADFMETHYLLLGGLE